MTKHSDAILWSCGHIAGSMCMQCHEELIHRANELAAEIEKLRATNRMFVDEIAQVTEEYARARQERDEAWLQIDKLVGRA